MKKNKKIFLMAGLLACSIFALGAGNSVFQEIKGSADVTTSYGTISTEYESTETYPFAVFKNGTLLGAYSNWHEALDKAKAQAYGKYSTDTVQILLRRDYNTDNEAKSFDNLSQIGGTLVLDLNGFTFTRGSKHIFNATAKHTVEQGDKVGENSIHDTKIQVKNGTMLAKSAAIVALNHADTDYYTERKTFDFDFTDVTFGLAAGATAKDIVCVSYWTGTNNHMGVNGDLTLTDCTIDLSTNTFAKETRLFNFNDGDNNWVTANATMFGGEIKLASAENLMAYKPCGDDDSLIFKMSDGVYTTLTSQGGEVAPLGKIDTDAGDRYFQFDETSTMYLLAECTHYWDNICDTQCNVCANERAVEHVYSNDCDAECDTPDCTGTREVVGHIGGEATCEEKAICETCGEAYGDLAEHEYSSKLKYDENGHWSECDCGAKSNVAEHSFGSWTTTKVATSNAKGIRQRRCSCGYIQSEDIPQLEGGEETSGGCGSSLSGMGCGLIGIGLVPFVLRKKRKNG